jgi:L-lactate dehydrogenase complex protein LldG
VDGGAGFSNATGTHVSAAVEEAQEGSGMKSERPNPFVNREPLKGGGREVFLARVRKGLGHGAEQSPAPLEAPPAREEGVVRQVGAEESREALVTRWQERAIGNSMRVQRVAADAGAVHAALDACFAGQEVRRCVLNGHDLEERFGLPKYLAEKSIGVLSWGAPGCREESFTCEAAITDCRAGMADSGSVVVWSDAGFGRSSTLVVPIHVVLLPASRILPDMIDALDFAQRESADARGGEGRLASNIVIINGPSKTADIEMNLVTGVHGPKFLHVVVVEGI